MCSIFIAPGRGSRLRLMGTHPQRDVRRNAWLKERGITLLRIPVSDLTTIDETADAIIRMAADRL
jgi:very-short-patch-repair endonuclease